jgi:3-phenylpropionate/trans-cinnamate dioxygenase ferredoxin reductase component
MIVIIGAGHAGVNAAFALREAGFAGKITLLHNENTLPYQRPPLSKAFMKGGDLLPLRALSSFMESQIALLEGEAKAINVIAKTVRVNDQDLPYTTLILAMGASARKIPNTLSLNSLADATALRARLEAVSSVHIYGAGFIGLEFAAVASAMGKRVSVSDIALLPMARAVSPFMSQFFLEAHRAFGVEMLMGQSIARAADLVLAGIGVLPNDTLAQEAGITCDKGIVINPFLETSAPDIYALGDVASPSVLSVQNAHDQAKYLAKRLTGQTTAPYGALPWFWSDQRDLKLQIAGLNQGVTRWEMLGDPATRAFIVNGYRAEKLICVETVNKPGEHLRARKLLSENLAL